MSVYDASEFGLQEDIGKWFEKNKLGIALVVAGGVVAAGGSIVGDKKGKLVTLGGIGIAAAGLISMIIKTTSATEQTSAAIKSIILQ